MLAARLRAHVRERGVLPRERREEALDAGAQGRSRLTGACGALVGLIADASYRVTDREVAAVRDELGSDRAAFELILSAGIGAGLRRWDAAERAIEGAVDEAG